MMMIQRDDESGCEAFTLSDYCDTTRIAVVSLGDRWKSLGVYETRSRQDSGFLAHGLEVLCNTRIGVGTLGSPESLLGRSPLCSISWVPRGSFDKIGSFPRRETIQRIPPVERDGRREE